MSTARSSAVNRKNARVVVTVTIPASEVAEAEKKALSSLARRVTVKGFRPGKAPMDAVKSHVSDESLHQETMDILLPGIVKDAQAEAQAKPVMRPSVSIDGKDPMTVTITFIERPKATLKKADSITIEKREVAPATDAEVDSFVRRILARDSIETAVDRAAKNGDRVRLRLHTTDAEGKEVKEITVDTYTMVIGEEELLPELTPHVTGMCKGEEKKASISFGAEHGIPGLRKVKATVHITVNDVLSITLPELTEAYLREKLSVEKTPDAFRSDIRDMLTAQAKDTEMKRREEALYAAVHSATSADIPQELIDEEAKELLHDFVERLKRHGVSLEQWMAQTQKKPDAVLAEMRDMAKERSLLRLGMQELANALSISPSQEDIKQELAKNKASGAEPGSAAYEATVFNCTMQSTVQRMIGTA